ncbi:type II toxin-antitoxin system HicB family antitoxin [Carnimonas bestiolae]|uniref:type II toxin-antitoxin system HicB family antitoxin n=1 Tax=Carnimonas bestiolae TaxID=3402172 RepID=UPI003EDBE8C8
MNNIMTINGHRAVIQYDPEIELLRGEFVTLNGGADFYADNVADLHKEGEKSLEVFLDFCKERNIEPLKSFSGKFMLRVPPETHAHAAEAAAAKGISLNQFVAEVIEQEVQA